MSLLIKALDKAQAEKTQSQQSEAKSEKAPINIQKPKKRALPSKKNQHQQPKIYL